MFAVTPLFVYKVQFMAELLVAEGLIVYRLRRRPHFVLRLLASLAACFAFAFFVPILGYNALSCSLLFTLMLLMTIGVAKFCFDEKLSTIIFCALAGYSVQHIAYEIFDFIIVLMGFNGGLPMNSYGDGAALEGTIFSGNLFIVVVYVFVYIETYWLGFAFTRSRMKRAGTVELKNMFLFVVVALIVFCDIVSSSFVTYYSEENFDFGYCVLLYLYNIVCCLLAMYLQFESVLRNRLEEDCQNIQRMWEQKKEQYEIRKENIDLINQKCHDLKHQIRLIGERHFFDQTVVDEIEDLISVYDATVKTGNEALDVILTEKSLFCAQNHIHLACIVDGKNLEFMKNTDLYALFGNLVDNAIEAVRSLPEDRKDISLSVKRVKTFLSVNIHNYYQGEIVFDGKLPVTSKADKNNHGFGMKSIQLICDKYDGEMTIETHGGIFNLNIIFKV